MHRAGSQKGRVVQGAKRSEVKRSESQACDDTLNAAPWCADPITSRPPFPAPAGARWSCRLATL